MTEFCAEGADAMRAVGARLAAALQVVAPDEPFVITLTGDLGAGKTTLVGGFLAAFGHAGPVRSPTYTLIEPYQLVGRHLQHCDFYRLRHPDELDDLGWRDLLAPRAILLVEWPERAAGRVGPVDLAISIDYVGVDARGLRIRPESTVGEAVLASL